MRKFALILAVMESAACGGSSGTTSSTAGGTTATASSTSASSATSTSTSTSASTSTSTAASTGSSTSSGSTTGSGASTGSSGSTTGGPSCGPNASWFGNTCLVTQCTAATLLQDCVHGDAGIGQCQGNGCVSSSSTDPNNCGAPGLVCPANAYCDPQLGCTFTDAGSDVCDGGVCPSGFTCYERFGACAVTTCGASDDGLICSGNNPEPRCCGGACIDESTDSANCGACGLACTGDSTCQNGVCTAPDCTTLPANANCTVLSTSEQGFCCGGVCLSDYNSEAADCGSCGTACAQGGTCGNGECTGYPCGFGATCAAGELCASALAGTFYCVSTSCDVLDDGTHCGYIDPDGVPTTGTCCAATCLQLTDDSNNCGACGVVCATGSVCQSGHCGPPTTCLLAPDGTQCKTPSGEIGECCGGACSDPNTDNANCRTCSVACPTGTLCFPDSGPYNTCLNAPNVEAPGCSPQFPCPTGFGCSADLGTCLPTGCDGRANGTSCLVSSATTGECCAGTCTDITSDNANCAACGYACPAYTVCSQSTCQNQGGFVLSCDDVMYTCPAGYVCQGTSPHSACVPTDCSSEPNGARCAYGPNANGMCCNNACAVLNEDPANCGGCGMECPGGSPCINGTCLDFLPSGKTCNPACPADQACSNGVCAPNSCSGIAASEICQALDGKLGLCCAGDACVDPLTDPANCGACGFVCAASESCANGKCSGASCTAGSRGTYCGGSGDVTSLCCGPTCIDSATDSNNCGGCGKVCATGTTCQASVCT